MKYILTLWLLWSAEELKIIQVEPFTSHKACDEYAIRFTQKVKADGVIASWWICGVLDEEDA